MTVGVGKIKVILDFRQYILARGREKKGKLTEYESVALNIYQYIQHTFLHTSEKGNTHRGFRNLPR